MDENEIVRAIGGLVEFKNQALEKFKSIDSKFEQVYDIKTELELIKQSQQTIEKQNVQAEKKQEDATATTFKKIEDTAKLITDLADRFEEFKNAPSKSLMQSFVESKKSVSAVFITLAATGLFYFLVRVAIFLIENTAK